jgi:RNA polymerase sigma factor FliA
MKAPVLEPAPVIAQKSRLPQQSPDVWRQYSKAGPGSEIENDLVHQYLPLVKTIVGRLAMSLPSHVNSEDLYSAGLVGLLNALRRFDAKTGTAFETYARTRIRGSIFDELRRLDWVPRSVHDKARKVEKVMRELEQTKGEAVTDAEMAKAMDLTLNQYDELMEEIRPATFVCLDSVRGGSAESPQEGSSRYDSLSDEKQIDPGDGTATREMARLITDRLEDLPDMQRKVLALYYFEDMRLREIAEVFGVTESRICQIHAQAILSIKAFLRKQDPDIF